MTERLQNVDWLTVLVYVLLLAPQALWMLYVAAQAVLWGLSWLPT